MQKPYSLDFTIERDVDRLHAVEKILDQLDRDPLGSDLEQMASYILYGRDENGQNAIQRNETYSHDKRYNSYKTSDDKVASLEGILENPTFDPQQLRSAYSRDPYKKFIPTIARPRYDKKTGELIDPGDSDIPGMKELWESIDRLQRIIDISKGKIVPDENDTIISDPYKLYQLKHQLIDIRRHQYYLKDTYKPTLHFLMTDHPKTQYYDITQDAAYWISQEEWQYKVDHAYTHLVSKNLEDYETREGPNGLEVKWIVYQHTFDWENPTHIRALINHYDNLYEHMHDKIDTYSCTLLWDLQRYIQMAKFTPVRQLILDMRMNNQPLREINAELEARFQIQYNENHLSSIISTEIPRRLAYIAKRERILIETPRSGREYCSTCGRLLPLDPIFFSRNRTHVNGFGNNCKDCERKKRLRREGKLNDK